ncbi:hypothetical protein [Ferrovibrio sp.]|uniref:hypothetical protein n=1 Tax=Ferrovibrio sp. TaxID=1917215 RepID=UPI003D14BCE2
MATMPNTHARRRSLAALLLGCGLLSGCGATGALNEPYFITVENQTLDPASALPLFSVCYNATLHKAQTVRGLVVQHCANPKLLENRSDLDHCSLAAPVRVTYACTAISRTAAESRPNLSTETSNFSSGLVF